jgi:hypothetical protein
MLQHTDHSRRRSAQRGLSGSEIDYVYQYGTLFNRDGARIYFLRYQDIPLLDRRGGWAAKLVGTALVVDREDDLTLLTAWRNRRRGLKAIRKKPAYRIAWRESEKYFT